METELGRSAYLTVWPGLTPGASRRADRRANLIAVPERALRAAFGPPRPMR